LVTCTYTGKEVDKGKGPKVLKHKEKD